MTWRAPNDLERFVLSQPLDVGVLALARSLVLAPRIEPLLLRNARLRFLPAAGAELEARLWFSPLVAARSSGEIVLHLGIASLLAGGLEGVARGTHAQPANGDDLALPDDPAAPAPHLDAVWAFTRDHTRHWAAADRLERDLRYHALRGDDQALAQGLDSLLAQIAREDDEDRRIRLSRLAKRTLPGIRWRLGPAASVPDRQLARYAALTLQDGGDWSDVDGEPAALPDWLAGRLPPPLAQAELGVEVRGDANNPVLHLVEPTAGARSVVLPSPLPARLHVRAGGPEGAWHSVTRGTCIPLDPPGTLVELTTLAGHRWMLRADLPTGVDGADEPAPPPLRLVHAAPDQAQAQTIADWLRTQGIPVELLAETEPARPAPRADQARAVRLWTKAARELWADAGTEVEAAGDTLMLCIDDGVEPVTGGALPLYWRDWQLLGDSPRAQALAWAVEGWWLQGEKPKIFVSYRYSDGHAVAAQVTGFLNQRGYTTWREEERLAGGTVVADEIERGLAEAGMVVVLDTPRAWESEWMWREIDAAIASFLPVLVVVLRPAGTDHSGNRPGFRNASESPFYAIAVSLNPGGEVEMLNDAQLNGLLTAMEDFFGRVRRSRRHLIEKTQRLFHVAGFSWQTLDIRSSMFVASKHWSDGSSDRMLVHCSNVSPRLVSAVKALQSYNLAAANSAGAAFNHRLFIYEPPLPRPELRRLAANHSPLADPLLRLFSPDQLANFLRRYQADPAT